MDRENDRKDEDDSTSSSESEPKRAKLKVIAYYLMLGFAPVVSVLALIIAIMAYYGNQSNLAQISETNSRLDSMNKNITDLKGEQEQFKLPFGHEKSVMSEERKKQGERETKIVKNVTQIQNKLKISPTLEEQMQDATKMPEAANPVASAPEVSHPVPNAASAPVVMPAPVVKETKPTIVPKTTEAKPAANHKETAKKPEAVQPHAAQKPAPVQQETKSKPATVQKGAEKPAPAKTEDKASSQVKSLRDAIKIYNQEN